jgi:C4-dicarboxylate-specific signal transduction histidine kinase
MRCRREDIVSKRSIADQAALSAAPAAEDPSVETVVRIGRRREARIVHSRKTRDRALSLARIGVWECDLASDRLSWSDGVYDLFELPRASSITRSAILDMYHAESRREMERLRAQAIASGDRFSLDIRIMTARGNERWLRLVGDVEREDGRAVRIFGTKQDVTEQRQAQERVKALQAELIQVSRKSAMGAMAATLAHELNQPLAAISNYVAGTRRALAEATGPAREKAVRGLDAIEEAAIRAGGIIRSLRGLTEGSAVDPRRVQPGRLIREAANLALAGKRDEVELRLDLADDLVLSVDPVQFQQVMLNLIGNAVDAVAGAPRREVVVSARVVGAEAEIAVEDSGPGIDPDRLPSLFDTFVSTKPGGLGIGLAVSRTIVEAHGGRLTAGNRPGGGAVFRIRLPVASVGAARPQNGSLPQSG